MHLTWPFQPGRSWRELCDELLFQRPLLRWRRYLHWRLPRHRRPRSPPPRRRSACCEVEPMAPAARRKSALFSTIRRACRRRLTCTEIACRISTTTARSRPRRCQPVRDTGASDGSGGVRRSGLRGWIARSRARQGDGNEDRSMRIDRRATVSAAAPLACSAIFLRGNCVVNIDYHGEIPTPPAPARSGHRR